MISEKQRKILAFPYSKYDTLICHGSIRSGKTSLMTVAFIDWAMENFDGMEFGICGKTVGSAYKNIVKPWRAMSRTRKRYKVSYNRTDKLLTVSRNGRTNTFEVAGGNDESSQDNIQGRTWAGVMLDEVALMPQSFVNQATARCSVDGSKLWFSCNPEGPRHWFYRDWILNAKALNALVLHFELDDNPSLSEKVKGRYKSQYKGVFYDRFIKGLWVVAEGLVYQFESESDYTCSDGEARGLHTVRDRYGKEVEAEGKGAWYISIDYGTVNPFAALLWRVTPDCAYVVDEYYWDSREKGRRRTDGEHLDGVLKLAGDRHIEAVVIDPSAGSFKQEMERSGRFEAVNAKNEVVDGIRVTYQMLANGLIKISDQCRSTITEMGLYRWDDDAQEDAVIKEYDHAMDSMRYEANTILKYELKRYL